MSIGGGSAGARSAVGAAGLGLCALGVAGAGRTAGRDAGAAGSVCTAAGTAASPGGVFCAGVVFGLALATGELAWDAGA